MGKERKGPEIGVDNLLQELSPEELKPRLEMQVLVDPLAALSFANNDVNCRDGGNCKINDL